MKQLKNNADSDDESVTEVSMSMVNFSFDIQDLPNCKRKYFSWFSRDVTATMLVYRTIAKESLSQILLYYFAKRDRHFAIVLYPNMAVSSCE